MSTCLVTSVTVSSALMNGWREEGRKEDHFPNKDPRLFLHRWPSHIRDT